MSSVHSIISTLSAVLGMSISILLLLLLKRQAERQSEWLAGILLGTVVFFMYASIFLSTILVNGETSRHGWRYFLTARILLAVGAFIPPIILFGWRVSPIFKDDPPISLLFFRFSLISGIFTAAVIWLGPSVIVTDKVIGGLLVWNGLLYILPGFYRLLKRQLSSQLRLCMKVTGSFYSVGLLASLATIGGRKEWSVFYTSLVLVQQMCLLVGILGSFIFVARFRFADVFVKWSLRLVGLGVLATLGAFGITTLSVAFGTLNPAHTLLIDTVVIFSLIALSIIVAPAIDGWGEHWVLQQADFKGHLVRISSGMLAIDSQADLLSWMDTQLIACLHLKAARTVPYEALPEPLVKKLTNLGDSSYLYSMPSALQLDENTRIETLIPIRVDGKLLYVLGICPGMERNSLLSGEVQFLGAVAAQAGVRIHHMEAEDYLRRQSLRESLLRQQLTEAELRALRAQVNPHFLFNSLNTIADFIVTNPPNAERMTLRLASIFRHVLAQSHRQFTSLNEEFDFLRNYLQIEQERFGERLKVTMSLDANLGQENIPTLLLQPIVENALKHGLAPKEGVGTLKISATSQGCSILLLVWDDGIGFGEKRGGSPDTLSRPGGLGLTNTIARLQTMYGSRASLNIESAPSEGCRISIFYPTQVPLNALSHN